MNTQHINFRAPDDAKAWLEAKVAQANNNGERVTKTVLLNRMIEEQRKAEDYKGIFFVTYTKPNQQEVRVACILSHSTTSAEAHTVADIERAYINRMLTKPEQLPETNDYLLSRIPGSKTIRTIPIDEIFDPEAAEFVADKLKLPIITVVTALRYAEKYQEEIQKYTDQQEKQNVFISSNHMSDKLINQIKRNS